MKKIVSIQIIIIVFTGYVNAQSPQFAVVRPDGTTFICPTWDSAYNKAQNDDYIYLPGVIFNGNLQLNKRIHIIGTGHSPDSTIATGLTNCTGSILLSSGASGGSIQGISLGSTVGFTDAAQVVSGYTIKRCKIGGQVSLQNNHTNFYLTENIILGNIFQSSGSGDFIHKNIIQGINNTFTSSNISNNIFTSPFTGGCCYSAVVAGSTNSTFNNNIFCSISPIISSSGSSQSGALCGNVFNNNLRRGTNALLNCSSNPTEFNTITFDSLPQIFVNYPNSAPTFLYSHDFHLKAGVPGTNAGNDGTDVGIYGTNAPAPLGWVPNNPHIYFKQVQAQTSADGRLQIHFKVRTGN